MPRKQLYSYILVVASVCSLAAQTQRTLGTSRTTTPDDAGGSDTSVMSNRGGPFNNQGSAPGVAGFQRPVIISGKVLLEDGSPPPDPVKIETECAAVKPSRRALLTTKGASRSNSAPIQPRP